MDNNLVTVIAPILLMALFGVPHGALDAALIKTAIPEHRRALTFSSYIATAILCVVAWLVAPTASMLFFLTLSTWHFGSSDIVDLKPRHPILQLVARGGIWTLFLPVFHWQTTQPIFAQLSADPDLIKLGLNLALPVWIFAYIALLYIEFTARDHRALVPAIGALMLAVMLPPLWALGLYFCLWHARRHTQHALAQISDTPHAKRLAQSLTILTLGIAAAVFALMPPELTIDTALVRIFFVGIFALTVPHMVLIDYYLNGTHQRGTNP